MTTPMLQHPDLQPQQPVAGNQYPAEVANFTLLAARNRTNDRAPHYFGSFKLNGQWYQVSTWITHARSSGEQQLSNSVRPCTPEEAARHEAREQQYASRQPQQTLAQAHNPLQQPTIQPGNATTYVGQAHAAPYGTDTSAEPVVDPNHPF